METGGVKTKLRSKANTSVWIGDSWWDKRFLSLFVTLQGSESWHFWSFSWCVFAGRVCWMRAWSVVTWFMLPLLSSWIHLYRLFWWMPRKKGVEEVLGWSRCWVSAKWKQQGESVGTVGRVLFGKLLCQSGNCS